MSYKNSLNDTFTSRRTGKAARHEYKKKQDENREIKEISNKYDGKNNYTGYLIQVDPTQQSQATTNYDGANVVRVRDECTAAMLDAGTEEAWKTDDDARNIINGMHRLMMVERDPNDDTVEAMSVGSHVNLQTYGKGSPAANGSINSLRVTAMTPGNGMGLVAPPTKAADAFAGVSGDPIPPPAGASEGVADQEPLMKVVNKGFFKKGTTKRLGLPCSGFVSFWAMNQLGLVPEESKQAEYWSWHAMDKTLYAYVNLFSNVTSGASSFDNLIYLQKRLGGSLASYDRRKGATPFGKEIEFTAGRWHIIQHWGKEPSPGEGAAPGHIYLVYWDGGANVVKRHSSYADDYRVETATIEYQRTRKGKHFGVLTLPPLKEEGT